MNAYTATHPPNTPNTPHTIHAATSDASSSSSLGTTPDAIRAVFDHLHAASRAAPLSLAQRRSALNALSRLLREQGEAACAAVDADFQGRPVDETRLLELAPSQQAIHHALKHLNAWTAPRRAKTGLNFLPAKSRIIPQPLGVVGVVAPWNYPILMVTAPMINALAAGNRVMVKMSEFTPATAAWLGAALHAALPADVCQVIAGDVAVAQAFCALPFDHLFFTGSTHVGISVMSAAAQNLTPVTLELGGKSPAIIGAGANMSAATRRIAVGKWRNAGQTCIAPDYVLVHRSQLADCTAQLLAHAEKMYPNALNNPAYASLINTRQFERLQARAAQAVADGAVLHLAGGEADTTGGTNAAVNASDPIASLGDASRHRMRPAVLTGTTAAMKISQEEIFGPLLPVLPYDTLSEAIAHVNAGARPLALYVFERDAAAIERVLHETTAGGVSVNETIMHIAQEDLPFGGVGASGMGHYHGRWGFDTFSKLKSVFYQSRWNALGLLDPPHGQWFYRIVKRLTG
jgi:coniferyl-aldehyde dehydrogenase